MTKPARASDFLPDARFTPKGHPQPPIGKVGVLLLNLGTPDATDYWSMRRYLKEFLSDRRVIEEKSCSLVVHPQRSDPVEASLFIR